jgi:beta-glucanase (GH16 family)
MRASSLAMILALAAGLTLPVARAHWKLVHEEDFSRRGSYDAAFWSTEEGFIRNREEQYYQAANLSVQAGALVLEARRESVPNARFRAGSTDWRFSRRTSLYTSAALVSRQPIHFGRVEVVARSPAGAGTWPAIWLLHEGGGIYGEIDLFEAVGKHPDTVFAAVHYGREARTRRHRSGNHPLPAFAGAWLTHTLEWTPQRITAAVNGKTFFTFDPQEAAAPGMDPLRMPMHLHLNLALGGSWGGTIDDARLPARFEIASVRVWRWEPAGDAPAVPPPDAPPPPPAAEPPGVTPRWGR